MSGQLADWPAKTHRPDLLERMRRRVLTIIIRGRWLTGLCHGPSPGGADSFSGGVVGNQAVLIGVERGQRLTTSRFITLAQRLSARSRHRGAEAPDAARYYGRNSAGRAPDATVTKHKQTSR